WVQVADYFADEADLAGATISVGITMFGVESDGGAEAVLAAADEAMYRAKTEGRNRVSMYEAPVEMAGGEARRLTPSAKIRNPITQNRLRLATHPPHALADPQPRRRGEQALRAAAADARRVGGTPAGLGLHRRRRARRDDPGA